MKIQRWERGLHLAPSDDDGILRVAHVRCLSPGQHTRGRHDYPVTVTDDGQRAVIEGEKGRLVAHADECGAALEPTITNRSQHDWPELAAIVPCFNPGPPQAEPPHRNLRLLDAAHNLTFFVSTAGLQPLRAREIHYNTALRRAVDAAAADGPFVWSDKWPTADDDAVVWTPVSVQVSTYRRPSRLAERVHDVARRQVLVVAQQYHLVVVRWEQPQRGASLADRLLTQQFFLRRAGICLGLCKLLV